MSTRPASRPVVVGVDESGSSAALRWAADEARRRSAPLCIVHALDQRHSPAFMLANPVFVADERRAAEQVLDTAAATARELAPGLDVRPSWRSAGPRSCCSNAHRPPPSSSSAPGAGVASAACCWARRRFRSRCMPPASSSWCPAQRTVRAPDRPLDGSSSGSTGSPSSECALQFAFTRARHGSLGLTAVRAWQSPADLRRRPRLTEVGAGREGGTGAARRGPRPVA